jgi:structural maintenance of chromosome 3 (chondroitin sulfate proteoglycan 6)
VRKQLLEVALRENLRLKLDSLNSQAIDTSAASSSGNLKEAQKELKKIMKAAAAIDAKLQESETQIEQAETKISNLEKEKLHREEKQQEIARAVEKHQKKMEKSIQKKALLQQAAAECAKNIRDLGVLPEEAFERFANTESSKVYYSSLMREIVH